MVNTHWQIYYENTSIMFNSCINRTAATILPIQHSRPSKGKLRFVEETLPHNPPGTTVIGDRLRVASQFCKCAVFLYLAEIFIFEILLLLVLLLLIPPLPLRLVIVAAAFVQIH